MAITLNRSNGKPIIRSAEMHKIPENFVYSVFAIAYIASSMDFNKAIVALVFAGGYVILATKKSRK